MMWFKSKRGGNAHPPIFIGGHQLQEVEEQRYLGVVFDNKLQWGPQVNYMCKKASYFWYLLSTHRRSLSEDACRIIDFIAI